ncbi:MAG: hypothetical protein M1828_007011 [Chrysothrix sp. TS-e1954]|nr:MAG: hypothetical protein M1828_007011 [Chrysothrix sp. TS-e1954]
MRCRPEYNATRRFLRRREGIFKKANEFTIATRDALPSVRIAVIVQAEMGGGYYVYSSTDAQDWPPAMADIEHFVERKHPMDYQSAREATIKDVNEATDYEDDEDDDEGEQSPSKRPRLPSQSPHMSRVDNAKQSRGTLEGRDSDVAQSMGCVHPPRYQRRVTADSWDRIAPQPKPYRSERHEGSGQPLSPALRADIPGHRPAYDTRVAPRIPAQGENTEASIQPPLHRWLEEQPRWNEQHSQSQYKDAFTGDAGYDWSILLPPNPQSEVARDYSSIEHRANPSYGSKAKMLKSRIQNVRLSQSPSRSSSSGRRFTRGSA